MRRVSESSSPVNRGPGGRRLRAPLGARRSRPPAIFSPLLDRSKRGSPPGRRNPPNQEVRRRTGGRGQAPPLRVPKGTKKAGGSGTRPYGGTRDIKVPQAPADGAPSSRALQGRTTRSPPHHGGAPGQVCPKRVAQTALWSMPHSGNGREKDNVSEATPRRYICAWFPYQALP